jgi:hypothetical protein
MTDLTGDHIRDDMTTARRGGPETNRRMALRSIIGADVSE